MTDPIGPAPELRHSMQTSHPLGARFQLPVAILLVFTTILSRPLSAQDVVISEFMASNDLTLDDENGDSEDWIELYNQSGTAQNLSGWYLTDDAANLTKWTIPDVTLAPGELLLIFASNKDRNDPNNELHTNFKISASGGYLGLVRPDGSTVEHDFGASYPQQVTDVSYGLQQSTTTTTLVAPGAGVKYRVPPNGNDDVDNGNNPDSWITNGFNDNSWSSGTTGLGYATGSPDAYDALISTDIQSIFYNQGSTVTSIYIRIPFTIANPASVSSLKLKMNYDDGFAAYLNGVPQFAASDRAPDETTIDYQSNATADHPDSQAVTEKEFTIDPALLNVGSNILCIHGLNRSQTSSDSLYLPQLEATSITNTSSSAYFTTPTPDAANSGGTSTPGPLIRSVTSDLAPINPAAGNLVIEADVIPTLNSITGVTLSSRIMYGGTTTVAMKDDGVSPDTLAGDGIFTASISTSGMTAGQMLRWKVTATDSSSNSSVSPPFPHPTDSPEYYGTIAEDPSIVSSNLPVLHWFTNDPNGAETTSGSRGSIYYLGQFYDNIQADRHGQSTGAFSKKSFDIDFNKGDRFLPEPGGNLAKDINLLTNWADKSKTRNKIGYEIMRDSGHPAHYSFPVRVQQNASFFSTADLVEDGDDRYLDRAGLDGDGALYKMYNRLDSTSGAEKKTRQHENKSDIQALIDGLGQSGNDKLCFGYDHMNIPGTINYLAALDMTNNRDHGHKNYYMYRDTNGTGEWRPLIWDIDLCLGRNWVGHSGYFDDNFTNNALQSGPTNRMKTLIFDDPVLEEMFYRRVRTLMDQMLGPPSAPVTYIDDRVNALVALIDPNNNNPNTGTDDADLDYQKWGSWGNQNAMRPAANRILNEFVPTRRTQLYGLSVIPAAQPAAPAINITTIDFNPASSGASSDQSGEYFILSNPNNFAVDCSDWTISGGINFTLPSGAVIPKNGVLHVGREAVGFRARNVSPKADEKRYLVSGYAGQLSARGETIQLHNTAGTLISSVTYPGLETPVQARLRITELLYHPADPTPAELAIIPTLSASDFEFIEITNIGTTNVDLSGAQFTDGVTMTFTAGTILAPGERAIVVANQAAFELRYGTGLNIVGEFVGNLDNAGEEIQITDAVGENVLEFDYIDDWYPQTDGDGYSLVLLDAANTPLTDFDLARNWAPSKNIGGDPAAVPTGFSMTFERWKYLTFSDAELLDPTITGHLIDLDGDGLSTVMEYALNLDPKVRDNQLGCQAGIVTDGADDYAGFTLKRWKCAIDLDYTVQVGDDLITWTPTTIQVSSTTDNGDDTETLTLRDTLAVDDEDRRFIRLRVMLTP